MLLKFIKLTSDYSSKYRRSCYRIRSGKDTRSKVLFDNFVSAELFHKNGAVIYRTYKKYIRYLSRCSYKKYFRFLSHCFQSQNMVGVCVICSTKTSREKRGVRCTQKTCVNEIHLDCLPPGLPSSDWCCKDCTPQPSMSDLFAEIRKISKYHEELARSIEFSHNKIDETNTLVKGLDQKVQSCFENLDVVNTKCAALEKENMLLKAEMNKQEQYSRINCVEIYGIPEFQNENVLHTVSKVYKALNVSYDSSQIDCCHRLGKYGDGTRGPRGIIVKFVSRITKQEFLSARKVKRNLSASDIDPSWSRATPSQTIYINESLTKANKILYNECKLFKKSNKIKYLWVKSGKILMRKDDKSNVFNIRTPLDLRDVH